MSDELGGESVLQNNNISKWDKFKSNIFKSIRISYMNWTYLPRSTGEEETWQQRLFRYSHFPMATQFFTYFAYRAACQCLYGRFFLYSTGIQYFLQDLNYTHSPMYRPESPEKQMLLQLGEALVLGAISTAIATVFTTLFCNCKRIHKVPHRSFSYYLRSTCTIAIPSVIGLFWSRRQHLTEGNTFFSQNGVVMNRSRKAGFEGACYIAGSRIMMSLSNVTVPLLFISLLEHRNMAFFTPIKGIIFTEFAVIAACLLTPIAMGIVNPIGECKVNVPLISDEDNSIKQTISEETVFYFRGYYFVCQKNKRTYGANSYTLIIK